MDVYDYPLVVLQQVEQLYKNLRQIVAENSDLIRISNDQPFNILVEGKHPRVFYKFLQAKLLQDGKVNVNLLRQPNSSRDNTAVEFSLISSHVIDNFKTWIELIRSYSTVQLTAEETLLKQYEDEFYEELEIVDEDASFKGFKLPQQVFIYGYLECVEKALDKEAEKGIDTKELKQEATVLKNELTHLTKKDTIKRLGRLLGKARKSSLNILSKIWDESVKEAVKRGVSYTVENHEVIIQRVQAFFLS